MTSIYKNFKITLFGSRPDKLFKQNKSLYDNFISMCSLPFFKPDSSETSQLIELLKECQLHSTNTNVILKKEERLQDIARLEIVKLAIHNWHADRKDTSSRVAAVMQFESSVKQLQTRLVAYDNNEFNHSIRTNPNAPREWNNPVFNHAELKSHLSTRLKERFNQHWETFRHHKQGNESVVRRYV